MSNPHKLKPGQKLWLQSWHNYRQTGEVTIAKVGRKYATLLGMRDDIRMDMETMILEMKDFGSYGKCYFSEEDFIQESALMSARNNLNKDIRGYNCPANFTMEDIQKVRKVLGLIAASQ